MKTIEEFSKEVLSNDVLRKELLSLKPENLKEFLEKHDCSATLDEVKEFLLKKQTADGLSEDELKMISGGKFFGYTTYFTCVNPNCVMYGKVLATEEGNKEGEVKQCPYCHEWTLKG